MQSLTLMSSLSLLLPPYHTQFSLLFQTHTLLLVSLVLHHITACITGATIAAGQSLDSPHASGLSSSSSSSSHSSAVRNVKEIPVPESLTRDPDHFSPSSPDAAASRLLMHQQQEHSSPGSAISSPLTMPAAAALSLGQQDDGQSNGSSVTMMAGGTAVLPCNMLSPSEAQVQLILWYKSGNGTGPPIYTIDVRNSSSRPASPSSSSSSMLSLGGSSVTLSASPSSLPFLSMQPQSSSSSSSSTIRADGNGNALARGIHFVPESWRERILFNLSARPPVLLIHKVRHDDSSQYSCRVSERKSFS